MPIVHCYLILALINSCLILSYWCVIGDSEYVLAFLLSFQKPEVRATAFLSHPQLVIHVPCCVILIAPSCTIAPSNA